MNATSDLALAIEKYLETRARVYQADRDQILREARGAREAARDHISRVVYELLQNAEDAKSESFVVHLRAEPPTAFFCDNGQGVAGSAVKSLAGLFLSPKTSGIGRKGIGFKAVFSICSEPIVISGNDAVVFNKIRARHWMEEKGLPTIEVPFQWLPFWKSRADVCQELSVPSAISGFRTIVALKLPNAEAFAQIARDCEEFDATSLLTFQNVRTFKVASTSSQSFKCVVTPSTNHGASVDVQDSRGDKVVRWRLHRAELEVPEDVLGTFDPDERERYGTATILLGIETTADGGVLRQPQGTRLLVYYPTRHRAPNKLLCHADFLVSSDRARIADPASNAYNSWLTDSLASETVTFANALSKAYDDQTNEVLASLAANEGDDAVIERVRAAIKREAGTRLYVKADSGQCLSPTQCMILACADMDRALAVARGLSISKTIVCKEILGDQRAIDVLLACGARSLNDIDLLEELSSDIAAGRVAPDRLALRIVRWANATSEWFERSGFKSQDFAEKLAQAAILPGMDQWYSPNDVKVVPFALCAEPAGQSDPVRIAYCHEDIVRQLPQVDDRDDIVEFMRGCGVEVDLVSARMRALHAFLSDWSNNDDDAGVHPSTFLRLIAAWKLTDVQRPAHLLGSVPVPVRDENGKLEWVRAFEAYRVTGTHAKLMSMLIGSSKGVPIVRMSAVRATGADEHVLEWLGCPTRPQIVRWTSAEADVAERRRAHTALSNRGLSCTNLVDVGSLKSISSIEVGALSDSQFSALLGLLAAGWADYYKQHAKKFVTYQYYSDKYLEMNEKWWEDVQQRLVPTSLVSLSIPFMRCRVVLPANARAFAPFVPAPLLPGIPEAVRKQIRLWMESQLGLVLNPEKMNWLQWKELLEEFVPEAWRHSDSPETLQKRIKDVYRAFLAWCKQSAVLNRITVMVIKRANGQSEIANTDSSSVYLNDEPLLARQCPESVLLFECHEIYRPLATRVMGVKRLSQTIVDRQRRELASTSAAFRNVHERFVKGRPFLLALLQTKRHDVGIEQHRELLERIRIVEVDQLDHTASVETESGTVTVTFSRSAESVENTVYVLSRESDSKAPVMAHAAREIARLTQLLELQRQVEEVLVMDEPEALYAFLADAGVSEETIREAREAYDDVGGDDPSVTMEQRQESDRPEPGQRAGAPAGNPQVKSSVEKERPGDYKAAKEREAAVKCKDGRTSKYSVREAAPEATPRHTPEPRVKPDTPTTPKPEPSTPDKRRIEESSRAFCIQHLAKLGIDAKEMDYSSVGFDIRATCNGRELRVEVKGHLGRSNSVNLTRSEWRMYIQSRTAESEYDWELWNVENVDANAGEAVLSRYADIPDEAVSADSFEVSLAKCAIREV